MPLKFATGTRVERSASVVSPVAVVIAALLVLAACGKEEAPAPASPESAAPPPTAAPASADELPGRPIVSERLPYGEVGDELVYGHFVFPTDMVEPLPAVIIIHEWWGLNDIVRDEADRVASQGYIVLAVDLFGGETTNDVVEARRQMLNVLQNQDAAEDNIRQAYEFVAETAGAPRVAALGWGLGGSWALNTATRMPGTLAATVMFYGQVSDEASTLAPIDAPLLGFFGDKDRTISAADVRAFESRMQELGKAVDVVVYPGAGHGFANPEGRNYDATLARQSWDRTLEFLAESLSSDGS